MIKKEKNQSPSQKSDESKFRQLTGKAGVLLQGILLRRCDMNKKL